MHGFFFAGEKQIQVVGGGVDHARGGHKTGSQEPVGAFLKRSGKITHQPEDHAAGVATVHGAHQERNDGGEKRSGDDAAEEKRGAVNLTFAAAKKINGGNRGGSPQEGAQRSEQ